MDLNYPLALGPFRTDIPELVAVLFGLLYVWYMRKERSVAFLYGIINVLIYVYICLNARLYAYASINVFYFGMSIYGWYMWSRGDVNKPLVITRSSNIMLIGSMIAIVVMFLVIRAILGKYTDSTMPFWDALTTAIYIIAMWMTAIKKLENWLLWIAGDLVSILLFAFEERYFSSLQFMVFTVFAILGYLEWRRKLIMQESV